MKDHSRSGELKYDKYGLAWIHDGTEFIPLVQNGEHVHKSHFLCYPIPPFDISEDPSGEDPRLVARLERIEQKLDYLLNEKTKT